MISCEGGRIFFLPVYSEKRSIRVLFEQELKQISPAGKGNRTYQAAGTAWPKHEVGKCMVALPDFNLFAFSGGSEDGDLKM